MKIHFSEKLYEVISGGAANVAIANIKQIKSTYDLDLECNIETIVKNEKFGFLYYPCESNGNEITSYGVMRIENGTDVTGETAGALDSEKAEAFLAAIESGKAILNSRAASPSAYSAAISAIVSAGAELLETANIDNTVAVNEIKTAGEEDANRENRLVYSEARKDLVLKAWEAKTTLLQNDALYLLSDKRALLEQIAQSENALCGNYDFPHNTYREFITRRDDELLRYCLSHSVRFRNYDSTLYGLEPILSHYKEQVIIGDSFYETKIPVKQALAINEQKTPVTCEEAAELTVGVNDKGQKRFGLLKFDLSSIQGDIQYASLQVTSNKSDSALNKIYFEPVDSWSGSGAYETLKTTHGLDSNNALQYDEDHYIASFSPIGKGKNSVIPVTDTVLREKNSDGTVSFRIQANGVTTYPNGYVGTTNTNYGVESWPCLNVTIGIVNEEELLEKQERILSDKKEFLDSITVCDIGTYGSYNYSDANAGEYPKDLYDKAKTAYDAANTATGVYEIAEALVKLSDAVRVLKDHVVLETDIDQNASLFFTSSEIKQLQSKVKSDPCIAEKYKEMKAVSDKLSLDELTAIREAVFTNDTEALDELGVLTYMPIGSGSNTKKIETSKMHVVGGSNAGDVAYGEIVVNITPGSDYKDNGVKNGYFAFVDDFVIKDSASNVLGFPNTSFNKDATGWRYTGIDTSYQSADDIAVTGANGEWRTTKTAAGQTGALYLENLASNANGDWFGYARFSTKR